MRVENKILQEKWAPVIDVAGLPPVKGERRAILAQLLENTEAESRTEASVLSESSLAGGDFNYDSANSTGRAGVSPIMIDMLRRAEPVLMAYDLVGVQAMSAPTQLIFVQKSRYVGQANTNNEALFSEANTFFSGNAYNETAGKAPTHGAGTDAQDEPTKQLANPFEGVNAGAVTATAANYGGTVTSGISDITGMATRLGEGDNFREMSFSIEKTSVTAVTRALRSDYTMELVQDFRAVHGGDVESILSNLLAKELIFATNREIIHTLVSQAKIGAQGLTANGNFSLLSDGQGRHLVERQRGLLYQIEKEANKINFDVRMGKGNFVLCTANVASALAMAGVLTFDAKTSPNLDSDFTNVAGVMGNGMKVIIDPYSVVGDYYLVGLKGDAYNAGVFYCPYVPAQALRAVHPSTFQPTIGIKSRYGVVSNPFAGSTVQANGLGAAQGNLYYRVARVLDI